MAIEANMENTIVGGDGSEYTGWGGTSFASPMYAAFMSLVNQQAALLGNPPVGFLNPLIYAIGKSSNYTNDCHDITTGGNENGSFPTMFSAMSGYDLCTGWGSPHGQALINALAGTNTGPNFSLTVPGVLLTSPNGLTVSQGSNVATTVTVISGSGFASSVNLSALNLPGGVTATFTPTNSAAGSTLIFTAIAGAVTGTNTVTVTVSSGSLNHTAPITLIVIATNQIVVPTIADSGFETPSLGSGNYQYNPSGAGWTFEGASPDGSGLVANGSGFSNPDAPQGAQAAFVQESGSIAQAISGLIPGTSYTLSFVAAERPGDAQSWNVTMNGTTIGSYNPGSGATAYTGYSTSFTATTATEILRFVGTDLAGGDNTIFIDNVRVTPVLAGTPAPPASLTAMAGNGQVSCRRRPTVRRWDWIRTGWM